MEVNRLTYKIYKYLIRHNWSYDGHWENQFIYMIPPVSDGFPEKFKLKLPISNKSKDFGIFMDDIISFLQDNYNTHLIIEFKNLNDKLKNRFKAKSKWIEPEYKSKIEAVNKFHPYFPKNSSWH
ncbi:MULTISPECIES: hypothetical protein [Flavobacteriaceae]|uniref:hypothetical protein n=1 Tax=Flavobacteriaceae TaxID=49546 RepID=UPI00234AB98D|nr:hypothetical protein [Muricauda sp. SP22]MDC6362994.1 hypothetical protein [Muricauda sp. SP22]